VFSTFFPPLLGGTGDEEKLKAFEDRLFPLATIKSGFRALKVYTELPGGRDQMLSLSRALFDLYILSSHDKLTRGRLENLDATLTRIYEILNAFSQADKSEAEGRVPAWVGKMKIAYDKAETSAQVRAKVNALWLDDPYLRAILEPGMEEKPIPPGIEKRVLSFIILQANQEVLEKNAKHLLALYYRELAERTQYDLEHRKDETPQALLKKVKSNWDNAQHWMKDYLDSFDITPSSSKWSLHLLTLQQRWDQNPVVDVGLVADFFKDLHRGLALRLILIDTLTQVGDKAEALVQAKRLAEDVAKLRDNAYLNDNLAKIKLRIEEKAKLKDETRSKYLKELERITNTLKAGESVSWIGHAAAVRANMLK
jgi:hypothetical protein